jgi:hypothetical protein
MIRNVIKNLLRDGVIFLNRSAESVGNIYVYEMIIIPGERDPLSNYIRYSERLRVIKQSGSGKFI